MDLWLAPMCLLDMDDANQTDLQHRFLRGGLPPFFLPEKHPERDFQEWMDAYWAKDIQELFRLPVQTSFIGREQKCEPSNYDSLWPSPRTLDCKK